MLCRKKKSHKVADSEVETYPAGGQSGTTGCFAGIFLLVFVNFVVKMLPLSFDSFFFLIEKKELNYSQSEAPIWTNTGVATHVVEQLK